MKKAVQNLFKQYYIKLNTDVSTKDSTDPKKQIKKFYKEEFNEILSEIDAKKKKEQDKLKLIHNKKKIEKKKLRKYVYLIMKELLKKSIEIEMNLKKKNNNTKLLTTTRFSLKINVLTKRCGNYIQIDNCNTKVKIKMIKYYDAEIVNYLRKYANRYLLKFYNKVEVASRIEEPDCSYAPDLLELARMTELFIDVKYSEPKFEY